MRLPADGIPAHLFQDWQRLSALVRESLGDTPDQSTVEDVIAALLRNAEVRRTWGVRGIVNGEPDTVWPRRTEADAHECARVFGARLPDTTIDVVRVDELTLPAVLVCRYPARDPLET